MIVVIDHGEEDWFNEAGKDDLLDAAVQVDDNDDDDDGDDMDSDVFIKMATTTFSMPPCRLMSLLLFCSWCTWLRNQQLFF